MLIFFGEFINQGENNSDFNKSISAFPELKFGIKDVSNGSYSSVVFSILTGDKGLNIVSEFSEKLSISVSGEAKKKKKRIY